MATPEFQKLRPGEPDEDILWKYAATAAEYAAAKADATKWFDDNIEGKGGAEFPCSNPSGNFVVDVLREGDRMFELTGICGSPLIVANGYAASFFFLYNRLRALDRLDELQAISPMETLRSIGRSDEDLLAAPEPRWLRAMVADYWDTLDQEMTNNVVGNSSVVVTINEKRSTCTVHVELGAKQSFAYAFYGAILVDRQKRTGRFAKWLVDPSNRKLDRKVHFDNAGLTKDLSPTSVIHLDNLLLAPYYVPLGCAKDECLEACNANTGTAVAYNTATGYVELDIEAVLIKPYCVKNPSGDPCP
jgi:hypothetical protein